MSKCHVRELNQVYRALFKDALSTYPTLKAEFEKDLTRLLCLVEQRGLPVYLVDLPAVGKHLDKCLAGGEYKLSGLPLTKRYSNRVVIPKFLRGLYLLVFDEAGCLKDDYDITAVFFLRQILFAAKKTPVTCSDQKVEDEVLAFYDVDTALPIPEMVWSVAPSEAHFEETYNGFSKSTLYESRLGVGFDCDCDMRSQFANVSAVLGILDKVSSILTTTIGAYSPDDWSFGHGPGAVSEESGRPDKYLLLRDSWNSLLDESFPISSYGYHNYRGWASGVCTGPDGDPPQRGAFSRLVSVPKDYKRPRLIAAEPCTHQWCQQNVWDYFRGRTSGTWISSFVHFRDQTRNQILCKRGSMDGSLCTVDLSSASDRVTCHAVGNFFRSNPPLLRALSACRTRCVRQRLTPKVPEFIELRKFSTMGSACTFPIESLMFLGIALSCVLYVRGMRATTKNLRRLKGKVSVFGDDIIIPTDCRELFFETLKVLDFKVNVDKSFWTGKFRESCGTDAFGGVDVTPAYWKGSNDGSPESLAMTVACSNNFYQKYLLHTSRYIASTIPGIIPMVPMRSGAFGLKTRTRMLSNDLRSRWNSSLQRAEVYVGTILSVQTRKPLTIGDTALLQYFTEAPSPYDIWSSGSPQQPLIKYCKRWVAIESLVVQASDTMG